MLKSWIISVGAIAFIHVAVGARPPKDGIRDFRDWNVQELLEWEAPEYLSRDYPYFMTGFDVEGSPIWIAQMGRWDVKRSIESGKGGVVDYKLYVLQFLARCSESVSFFSNTPEEALDGFSLIVDMDGYGSRQISSPAAVSLQLWAARQFEQAFSRSVKQAFVINSGYAFTTIWNLMKPILGPNTYKVEVLGSNQRRWLPQLLRVFPEDQLPSWIGGVQHPENIITYG